MKKFISILLAAAMTFSLAACGSNAVNQTADAAAAGNQETDADTESQVSEENEESEAPETITVTCLDGAGETVEVTVPYDPQRVAVVDMATLDILDNLGLGDRVVGSSSTSLDYLQSYVTDDSIAKLGSIKEADMEAVMACEPEIIFMGGRMSESYDALSEIAPVIRLTTDTELGVLESTRKNAHTIASIFGKEAEVDEKFADFDGRIAALKEVSEGKTAVIGMCTSGSFNVVGNGGRCSVIGVEVGFENLCNETASDESSERSGGRGESGSEGEQSGGHGKGESTETSESTEISESTEAGEEKSGRSGNGGSANNSAHGSEASFELIVDLAPDYIFVMDRDAAIGTNGAQLAKDIMENELVMSTDAYKNGNLVILEHPAVWYTAEGGVTALSVMLDDLESALLN